MGSGGWQLFLSRCIDAVWFIQTVKYNVMKVSLLCMAVTVAFLVFDKYLLN